MHGLFVRLKSERPRRPPARWAVLALGLAVAIGPVGAAPQPVVARVLAEQAPPRPLLPDRSTPLPRRAADSARLHELAAQRAFQYVEPDASTDAWDAFWARIWRWLSSIFDTRGGRVSGQYVIYAVALAALVFAVLKLLQVDMTGAFGRSGRRNQLAYDTELEDIHGVDFGTRIAEAEAAGNFRLATRLGYLEVLKQLTDRGLIDWQPDKTNHAYLAELGAGPLREAFRGATRQFEYVWYGELRLNTALYAQARTGQRAVARLLGGAQPVAPSTPALSA